MTLLPFAAFAALLAGMIPAAAAPAFPCPGPKAAEFETVCRDPDLVRLDRAVDAAFTRRLAGADPVTALLLKRDQRWFNELVGGRNIGAFDGRDDDMRKRMLAALETRLATLGRLDAELTKTPAGEWANAFGTAKVEEIAGGALRVEVTLGVAYAESDDHARCGATAELKYGSDGWYAGLATRTGGDDAADNYANDKDQGANNNSPFQLRLRLQVNTLRIVVMPSEQDSFCATPEQVTGTYFTVGPQTGSPSAAMAARMAAVAARTAAPSFACASATTADEEEICADPELAARDVEIARTYREALRRLDARSANFLRDDQRAYVKDNALAFESELFPGWDKQTYYVHHTGNARNELFLRLRERLAMLTNLEPARQSVAGV